MGLQKKSHSVDENIDFYFIQWGECHNINLGAQSPFTMGNKVALKRN
jgi:hypothetical protein